MLNTPFSPWPSFTEEEASAVRDVILSNKVNYWTGQECREFEREFAAWSGTEHAIALMNGTVALDVAVKYCACQYFNGRPLHINFQGVAQHYGFHTDMLDVTSNFDVATFFACCQWNDDAGCYLPVGAREAPGIIYGVEPAFYSMGLVEMAAEFSFVGWQPLPRPAQQRASAFILPANQCFASLPGVRKHYFRHNEQSAEAIWRAFDGGDVLFPADEAVELSRLAQDLGVVTTSQLARAWQILETWEGIGFKKKRRKGVFKASGLKIVEKAPLNWTRFNLPSKPEKLRDRLNSELDNVRFRMTYTPPA